MPQPEEMARLGERFGGVRGPVVAHHPVAFASLAAEPGQSTAVADRRWILLVGQHLDVGQPFGVDDEMALVLVNSTDWPCC